MGRDERIPNKYKRAYLVSIHAPAWGATLRYNSQFFLYHCFNPRARVGRDDKNKALNQPLHTVSIHAPAWGATPFYFTIIISLISFNPRARVGRDYQFIAIFLMLHTFQSTRPRGARLYAFQLYALHKNNSMELRKFKM